MKLYFFGLAVLFLFSALNRVLSIYMGTPPVIAVSYVADIILFALCLRVAYGMAFSNRWLTQQSVRLIYWGVMVLGMISLLTLTKGELLGLPDLDIHALSLLLWMLPYPLFALPCILLERLLKEDEKTDSC